MTTTRNTQTVYENQYEAAPTSSSNDNGIEKKVTYLPKTLQWHIEPMLASNGTRSDVSSTNQIQQLPAKRQRFGEDDEGLLRPPTANSDTASVSPYSDMGDINMTFTPDSALSDISEETISAVLPKENKLLPVNSVALEQKLTKAIPQILINRLPKPVTKWFMVLDDIAKERIARTKRIERKSESVDEFIARFPINDK